jgi:hypothetical protein
MENTEPIESLDIQNQPRLDRDYTKGRFEQQVRKSVFFTKKIENRNNLKVLFLNGHIKYTIFYNIHYMTILFVLRRQSYEFS